MDNRFRQIVGVIFFLFVASCSGGGCSSGCGGCAGTTALPRGFPKEKAITNAATVRLSRPGLDFVETQLPAIITKTLTAPGGVLGFDIPNVDPAPSQIANLSIFGKVYLDANVCPDGAAPNAVPPKCRAAVGLGKATFQLDAVKPNAITLRATVPLQLDDTPIQAKISYDPPIFGPVDLGNLTLHVGYGDGDCNDGLPRVTPHALPIGITIPLVEETTAPRTGYMKIDVDGATVDLSGLSANDVRVCSSCSFASEICSAITDSSFVKGLVVDPLKSGLADQVKSLLADQLCMAPSTTVNPPCPTGTSPDAANKRCVYDGDKGKCVSLLLGTDAHVNLDSVLKSISPGTTAGLDFGLAAGGAMQPFPKADANAQGRSPNGVTVGLLGGVIPQPPSKCVTQAELKIPTGIPFPDELAPTALDSAAAPHLDIALAGRFLDYTFGSVYNSGLLCLGVSSDQFELLRSGLLSVFIPSLKSLAFEHADAAVAIATRPLAPPQVKIGAGSATDPLLAITLPKFAIDFYLWHLDRYVRVFTYQADLTIPVNLQTGAAGLTPVIGDIKVANGTVTNADLIMEDPALVAGNFTSLLGGIGKQLVGGGFSPIDLSSALKSVGLGMDIGKITKLTKGSDDFVGIFATLKQGAATATAEADTAAVLVSKKVPVEHMQLATMTETDRPELVVDASSPLDDGRHSIEYSWWIDGGTRSAWSLEKHLVITDSQLLLQGRHVLRVAARVASEAASEDATPAEVPFTIDALAPLVNVTKNGPSVAIDAWDVVSAKSALVGRYRLDGAAPGAFRPLTELAHVDVGGAEAIEVEVKDEEGNVRSVSQALRGRGDGSLTTATSGCGCSTPGAHETGGGLAAAALGLAGLALIALRRRGERAPRLSTTLLAIGSLGLVASTSQGCSCGSEDSAPLCGSDCAQECLSPLPLGLPGSYTSLAKAPDGTLWVAGYNDALLSEGDSSLFGDLVVGKYDRAASQVAWQTVDGLPTREPGTCADRAADSWRHGESDAGDDVGLFTSVQVGADGHPMVSYYDATHHTLKFAFERDGTWSSFTLREQLNGDAGRYSKMLLVSGKPVIAFLQIEPGNGGRTRSKVVVARANVESPTELGAFRFEDAAVEEDNPCSATSCNGQSCVKSTGLCTATVTGCTPAACASGQACVTTAGKATCEATKSATQTYPDVFGDFISLAQGNGQLGMVVYDRPHGNLVALAEQGEGKWVRTIVDGETGSRADKTAIDTGDVGIAASLAIDSSGLWHVSYVSGLDETLRYLTVSGGKPGKSEIIDDGTTVDGKALSDGKHVVGDDSAIRAEGDNVTVYYQDVTVGTLRRAVGTRSGATHAWTLSTVPQPGKFGGYFPQFVPGEDSVASFWEQTDKATKSRIGDVSILTP